MSDLRLLPTISREDSIWTVEISKKYYQLICRNQVHKAAIVLADATFTKLTMDSMINDFKRVFEGMNHHMRAQYFTTPGQAMQWLID